MLVVSKMSIAPLPDVAIPWVGYTKSGSSRHISPGTVESMPFLIVVIKAKVLRRCIFRLPQQHHALHPLVFERRPNSKPREIAWRNISRIVYE